MNRRRGGIGAAVLLFVAMWLMGQQHDAPSPPSQKPKRRLSRAELEALAKDVGFPDPAFAATIALRESGGDPNAILDTRGKSKAELPPGTTNEHSIGLWQINVLAWPKYSVADLLDPRRNAEAAFEISERGTNWKPWSTAKTPAPKPKATPAPPAPEDFEP